MDYGALLADSWKTIWKYKVLLMFGAFFGFPLLASLALGVVAPEVWTNLFSETSSPSELLFSLLVLAILLALGSVVSIIAQVGIQTGVRESLQQRLPVRFLPLVAYSRRYFWRVLGAWLTVGAVLLVVMGLTFGCQIAFGIATAGLGVLCVLLFLPIGALFLSAALDIATGLSPAAIVVDDMGLGPAFHRTWTILKRNTREVFLIGLLLSVLVRVVSVLLALPDLLVSLLTSWVVSLVPESTGTIPIIAFVLYLAYLPIHVFGLALCYAFAYSAWTLAYLRLSRPMGPPEQSMSSPAL